MESNELSTSFPTTDLFLYDAKRAELTGISNVLSFTDSSVIAECKFGELSIEGEALRIESFDSSKGNLSVSGNINGFFYFDKSFKDKKKKGLFAR